MIVLYGAGNEFINIVKSGKWNLDNRIIVVDSDSNKVGTTIEGYIIQDKSVLKQCSEKDFVYITSDLYRESILKTIKELNDKVKIADNRAMRWLLNQSYKVPIELAQDEYYESATKQDVERWIVGALDEEMRHWRWMVPKIRDEKRETLYTREFLYPYNPEIDFKKDDIIVDVGCGPIPKFGNIIAGQAIDYIPVDPLAYQYNKLLDEFNVDIPVKPKFAIMEALSCFYEEDSVDYCIVNNALDHSIDIVRAFLECLRIVKPGGCLLLEHWEAEAISNDYEGLHKWNIEEDNSELIFFSKNMKVNITKMISGIAEVEVRRAQERDVHRDIIIAKITKKKDIPKVLLKKWDGQHYIGQIIEGLFSKLV